MGLESFKEQMPWVDKMALGAVVVAGRKLGGSPYASADYRAALATSGLVASMSRKGDCWDNAVAESFFGTLRAELIDHEQYRTHEAATRSIADYVESFYNIERRHSLLDYLNPIEFELRSETARVAA